MHLTPSAHAGRDGCAWWADPVGYHSGPLNSWGKAPLHHHPGQHYALGMLQSLLAEVELTSVLREHRLP